MSRALGNNINVDFNSHDLRSICHDLKDETLAVETSNHVLELMENIINDLQAEKDAHMATLNVLGGLVVRLLLKEDPKSLIDDIEQYLKDLGRE